MERLTFVEKLQITLNSIFASDLLLVMIGFMLLAFGTYFINKKFQNKIINRLLLGSIALYLAAQIALIFPKLFQIFEVITQEILKQYYFPNMVILLCIYAISCFIGAKAIFQLKKEKFISIMNISFFILINLLYTTLITYIIDANINITMGMLLYQDEKILAILEMITFMFMILIIINTLVYATNLLIKKIDHVKNDKSEVKTTDF